MRCGFQEIRSIPRWRSQPGSITARSYREIRVQFPQACHDLTAIHYLYSMPRGYRSRHRDTHEIIAFCTVSGFVVSRLATIH